MLLFKYLSPDGAQQSLSKKGLLHLKFGLPSNYNDPYELFLQTNKPLELETQRAFYEFFLGEIPQMPVTCFSKRPDSVVMWAHYGREMTGICLGFDEYALTQKFPVAYIDDVQYSDQPAQIGASLVDFVFNTGKRRHALQLLRIAHKAAYFVKRADWSYEAERRLVVSTTDVKQRNGALIASLDSAALRYIIIAKHTDASLRRLCQRRARQLGIPLLEFRTERRTFTPLFVAADNSVFEWNSTEFRECSNICEHCQEPSDLERGGICAWCAIGEEDKVSAGSGNMLTASVGIGT